MTVVQKFLKKIVPASLSASMEKETREWMLQCVICGAEKSGWEAGGIRWKASGNPKRRMFCEYCKQNSTHQVYRKK